MKYKFSSILLSALLSTGSAKTKAPFVYKDFTSVELGELECEPEQDYETLLDAHLIHYTSDDNYDKFEGTDLVNDYAKRPRDVASVDGRPKTVRCVGKEETEDGTWHVQRIGPFRSTGGNDWWQFAYLDMFGFNGSIGEKHRILGDGEGSSYGLTGHWSGPITPDGRPIGLPPLHIHHIHLTEGAGFTWSSDILDCVVRGYNCPDGGMIFAHHGDKQLHQEDDQRNGGIHTFGEDYGSNWAKKIYEAISGTGEINDLRPAGSPEIEWWYQTAVRVVSGKKSEARKPLSMHYLYNPFEIGVDTQFSRFATYRTHPSHDSVHVYTGRMPFAGELVHADGHEHMAAAQQMFLFEGTPEDLGLGALAFDYTWVPLKSSEALHALGLSTGIVSEPAAGANNQKIVDVILDSVAKGRAYQVCHSKANRVRLDGMNWDRAGSLECNSWSFDSGTQYTSVAFNGNTILPDMLDAPGLYYNSISKITRPRSIPRENTFPQHSHWFLCYTARHTAHSYYTWQFSSQDPDALSPVVTKVDLLRILVWGSPRHAPGFFDSFVLIPVLNLALSLLKVFNPTFTWFSPWPLRTAFYLLVGLFVATLAAFRTFLWAVRKPSINEAVNEFSMRLSGRYVPIDTAKAGLPDKAHYPIGIEIMTYIFLAATFIAICATATTMVVPGEVYLISEHGQKLVKEASLSGELNWITGKPGAGVGLSAPSVAVVVAMIVGLGTIANWCLRNTQRAELARRRLSMHIRSTKAIQTIQSFAGFDMEDDDEDDPLLVPKKEEKSN